MKFFIIVLLILLIIFFIPIRIKLKIHYSKNSYYIKLYRLTLFSNKGGFLNKFLKTKNKNNTKDTTHSKEKSNMDDSKEKAKNKKSLHIRKLYYNLQKNKFKPKLKFSIESYYSLDDAAKTAILFGLLNSLNLILYKSFTLIFRLKKIDLQFTPEFNNKLFFNITIDSIITFNFAQIIYILFLVRDSFKEVPL